MRADVVDYRFEHDPRERGLEAWGLKAPQLSVAVPRSHSFDFLL